MPLWIWEMLLTLLLLLMALLMWMLFTNIPKLSSQKLHIGNMLLYNWRWKKYTMEVHFRHVSCVFFFHPQLHNESTFLFYIGNNNENVFTLCFFLTPIFSMETRFYCVTINVQWKCVSIVIFFLINFTKWKHASVVYLHNKNTFSFCKLFCKRKNNKNMFLWYYRKF